MMEDVFAHEQTLAKDMAETVRRKDGSCYAAGYLVSPTPVR
jgi:hypothetical protein